MSRFLERMKESPLVFDGAMGTLLYGKGVFINTCYDELCLTRPEMVSEIHADYARAGADVVETNTFGANRVKMRGHGLGDKVEAVNRAAARLAREAVGADGFVAGAVGPCTRPGQILPRDEAANVYEFFREQIGALVDEGVDVILLETFVGLEEIQIAARCARDLGAKVAASMAFNSEGVTALGAPMAYCVDQLDKDDNVDLVGMNCVMGPAEMYEALEAAIPRTDKPFLALPNAGVPKEIEGRRIYMTTPEYFTEYAKRFIELGARGVGGCCGTTPDHIRTAARAVKGLTGVKQHATIAVVEAEEVEVEVTPLAEKSRLGAKLAKGEPVTSIEILPPRTCDLSGMMEKVRTCHINGVDTINIPDGPRASARVSPMIAAIAIKNEVGIEPFLHYCCRDRNLIGIQSDLMGAQAAGLRNFLFITGDPPKLGDWPDVTGVFDIEAVGLTQVAHNLNHGYDIGGAKIDPPTSMLIGVGANPCAVEPQRELERFRRKMEAGAETAITQPVFDPEALFRFLDEAERLAGRLIPIIAGVWPLVSFKNAEFMNNEVPGVEIPDAVMERMSRCETREEGQRAGVEIAREIRDAIAGRVAGFQVSAPFGNVDLALEVLA